LTRIAIALQQALARRALTGSAGRTTERKIAGGRGWTVSDVVCTCDRHDRLFEEQHKGFSITLVTAGSFQYRASISQSASRELMTPGSLLLGNPGQTYECGHEHRAGDRCLSFWYAPDHFEKLAADAGNRGKLNFRTLRLPPLRELSPLFAQACAGLAGQERPDRDAEAPWEELSLQLAAETMRLVGNNGSSSVNGAAPSAVARVTRAVRMIERHGGELTVGRLAQEAGLSAYHFLRVFEQLTGLTPHRYLLRLRLRQAAMRLATEGGKVLDIALDCGFGDVSNFNRAFRAEFGINPSRFRSQDVARSPLT
jgi:AraC-like DNA-binding protein